MTFLAPPDPSGSDFLRTAPVTAQAQRRDVTNQVLYSGLPRVRPLFPWGGATGTRKQIVIGSLPLSPYLLPRRPTSAVDIWKCRDRLTFSKPHECSLSFPVVLTTPLPCQLRVLIDLSVSLLRSRPIDSVPDSFTTADILVEGKGTECPLPFFLPFAQHDQQTPKAKGSEGAGGARHTPFERPDACRRSKPSVPS
jgi:hypothetical protein